VSPFAPVRRAALITSPGVATVEECEAALRELAALLASVDSDTRRRNVPERTVACEITDLRTTYRARLGETGLSDISPGVSDGAQIRLRVTSDDLLALTSGRLNFATAWATGRIRIDASITDLLRLRSML
jgi:hypothetical protein